MNIFIVGAGQVGCSLAKSLAKENHKITLIDPDEEVLNGISNRLDVICYVGNGASFSVLQSAGIEECDLLIALTISDEINMLSCLCAHKLNVKHTVARVRNPEYTSQLYELKKDLGLTMYVNPEKAAAETIARIIRFPAASRVELFAKGRVELVSCKVQGDNPFSGMKLRELSVNLGVNMLICAVDRNDELIIPDGEFEIKEGDELYITGAPKEIEKALRKAKMYVNPIKNLIIYGSGRTTYHLCEALSKKNISIKIMEKDRSLAEEMASLIPGAVVLHGDASDEEFLFEEGIRDADAFVALGGTDEENILSALFAKRVGVKKIIAKTDMERMSSMVKDLNIEASVSPKTVTVNRILRYVRAMEEGGENDNILSIYKILDGRAEIVEFLADEKIEGLTGIALKDLKLKKNLLIAAIVHNNEVIIPRGGDFVSVGDSVLVVTANRILSSLSDITED